MADLAKMGPMGLNALGARDAAIQLAAGDITSEAIVRDCLDRIDAREGVVHAWDYIDPDYAIAQAKTLDGMARKSVLHGVPVGIKDIFDTLDMPTAHGFGPYAGDRSGRDSNCVAALRAAGMVIMGKTVTTEFACPVPRQTRNPHNPDRTAGVSSSGSGASVADFMVPLAVGSQTGGSVIGPSANCGVYGYKASLDGIDRGGFRHCKPSIDTIGLFARSVDDLILMRAVQTGGAIPQDKDKIDRSGTVRIGVVRTPDWDTTEPCMQAAIERAADVLGQAGAKVSDVTLPQKFSDIIPEFSVINGWEAMISLADEIKNHPDAFNDHNRKRIEEAGQLKVEDYERAGKTLDGARAEMNDLFSDYDVFITPSLAGEAQIGHDRAIGANFSRLWTQMYAPAVNVVRFTGPNDMPVCFQVIGPKDSDDATLAFADWIDARLGDALGPVPEYVA
ncbi:MAG: amidase [Alphaproteobacteria bacterium]|jgi:Asp-tRNA(Asn)/Glu-tRNA(Gln) amidotransferase A subunit family amidase